MSKILGFKQRADNKLKIVSKSATKAEIILYAGIGQDFWGDGSMISAKQFSDELKNLGENVSEIDLRINSPGGDVFDGVAIYNRLKQHKAKINVYVDGLAASIASIIALAGDEIHIGEGALMMIHLPWTMAIGNRMELDNTVNRLLTVEEQMVSIYQKKTGLNRAEIKAYLEKETWMNADEAIDLGFADEKFENATPIAASAMNARWITRAPKNYRSETVAIDTAKNELKKKIQARLARK